MDVMKHVHGLKECIVESVITCLSKACLLDNVVLKFQFIIILLN